MYWHINNARGEVAETREIGGGRLKLKNASAFGDPSELNPLRISVFANEAPVTMLRCHGRDGDDLLVSGPIDGFDDAECHANMTVWNTPTAGDFNDLRDALEAIRDGLAFSTVTDDAGNNWMGAAPVFHDPASNSLRTVSVSRGLPVSVVGGLAFPDDVAVVQPDHSQLRAMAFQGGYWLVNLAEGSTVALATGSVVGLVPGAKVGVEGPVTVAQSNQANLRGTAYQGGAWTVGFVPGSSVNVAGAVDLAGGAKVAIEGTAKVSSGADVGALYDGATALVPRFAKIAAGASGDNVVIPGAPSKRIRVLRWGLTAKNEVDIAWRSGSTPITGERLLTKYASAGGAYCPVGVFETLPGDNLVLNLSAAADVGGELTYVLV